jgi:hypothetical protein
VDVFMNLRLAVVDSAGHTVREEQTVTENLSGRGCGDLSRRRASGWW